MKPRVFKRLLAGLAGLFSLQLVGGVPLAYADTQELVVAAYGGAYTDTLRKSVGEFEKSNNVKIKFVPASGADGIALAKSKGVDIVHADPAWSNRGEAIGLFEKLDPAVVSNMASVFPRARLSEYSVATNFGQYGIAYNPKLVSAPPTSWFDLAKPEYKGKISTAGFDDANVELLVLFSKLNGGSEDKIDPGFTKMKSIAANISVFYSQHPQLLDLFRSGDVVAARWLRGRVQWAKTKGVDLEFAVPKEGAVALVSTVHVVKGRPNIQLAMKFVNHLLSKDNQVNYAKDLGYTPARADLKSSDIPDNVPYGKDVVDALVMANWRKVTPQLDAWKDRWNKEIAR